MAVTPNSGYSPVILKSENRRGPKGFLHGPVKRFGLDLRGKCRGGRQLHVSGDRHQLLNPRWNTNGENDTQLGGIVICTADLTVIARER